MRLLGLALGAHLAVRVLWEVSKQMFNALSLLFQSLNKRLICGNFSAFFLLNGFLQSVKVILLIPILLVVFSLLFLLFTTTLVAKKRLVSGDDIRGFTERR